jgi:microcystin-dependent protein
MATYEATKYNFTSNNLTGSLIVATGTIVPWTVSSAPTGYLECDGAAVSRSTYSALFAVIGTTYGAGDGSSTFALPDLKDRVVYGKSSSVSLASTGGAATVTPAGTGTVSGTALTEAQMPKHYHLMLGPNNVTSPQGSGSASGIYGGGTPDDSTQAYGTYSTGGSAASGSQTTGTANGNTHTHSFSFSGDSQTNLQPYLCLKFMIKI